MVSGLTHSNTDGRDQSVETLVSFLLPSLDVLAIALAWACAYFLRFNFVLGAQEGLAQTFIFWSLPLVLISIYFLARHGLYDQSRLASLNADIMQVVRANGFSVVAFVVAVYFFSDGRISRLTIVIYAAISLPTLILMRCFARSCIRKFRRRGFLTKKVLLIGDGLQAAKYRLAAQYTPASGLVVHEWFGLNPNVGSAAQKVSPQELKEIVSKTTAELVVLAFDQDESGYVDQFISQHYDRLFAIHVVVNERQSLTGLQNEALGELHLLALNQPKISVLGLLAKRSLDVVATGVGLVVLSPLLIALAIAVRASSEGPIFFGQERVGMNGRRFKMWKFRSMKQAAAGEQSIGWTVENDPRRTKVGTFIRATSLDELPQLWNVFTGDMSLVGPRPEQSYFVEKFKTEIPAYMLRHKMKCGITGWAQVNGWRGDTSLNKRIECDLFYIRNWSIWFDFKILLLTVVRGFINKNAY
ncbi:MAG: undecaprenyl-phosphate glucose phosphotransferase [Proteobacteria bacterium]|nr:MAG: undecaprenyl-phosphate glucose phosphotransferase [Pseudomonadota bacterium]